MSQPKSALMKLKQQLSFNKFYLPSNICMKIILFIWISSQRT
ncbi:unnamed protein product [Onchocerca flexuosa]|uniref:Uncharacterized protein n=1 Tax=Onchocerca flexuosa TaxID=387005 RepID=A0A183HX52_9BILA|nr:unnamed protein product [Onchocerca flexuosa]